MSDRIGRRIADRQKVCMRILTQRLFFYDFLCQFGEQDVSIRRCVKPFGVENFIGKYRLFFFGINLFKGRVIGSAMGVFFQRVVRLPMLTYRAGDISTAIKSIQPLGHRIGLVGRGDEVSRGLVVPKGVICGVPHGQNRPSVFEGDTDRF